MDIHYRGPGWVRRGGAGPEVPPSTDRLPSGAVGGPSRTQRQTPQVAGRGGRIYSAGEAKEAAGLCAMRGVWLSSAAEGRPAGRVLEAVRPADGQCAGLGHLPVLALGAPARVLHRGSLAGTARRWRGALVLERAPPVVPEGKVGSGAGKASTALPGLA